MNAQRRKRLADAQVLFEDGKSKLEQAQAIIEECKDEEQEYFDNMPEGLQYGYKGTTATEAIDLLETAQDNIQTAIDALEDPDWGTITVSSLSDMLIF